MSIYGIVLIAMFVCLMLLGIGDLPIFFRTICVFFVIACITWFIVCGIFSLVFWCFGLEFTARIGTGIFLVVMVMLLPFIGK